jgi:hypothetical protein
MRFQDDPSWYGVEVDGSISTLFALDGLLTSKSASSRVNFKRGASPVFLSQRARTPHNQKITVKYTLN